MQAAWLAVLLLAVSGSVAAVERVVSLAPSLSEIVVELGSADLLVGVLVAAIAAKGGFDILRDARLARRDAESSVT